MPTNRQGTESSLHSFAGAVPENHHGQETSPAIQSVTPASVHIQGRLYPFLVPDFHDTYSCHANTMATDLALQRVKQCLAYSIATQDASSARSQSRRCTASSWAEVHVGNISTD